ATRIDYIHVVGLASAGNQAPSLPTITEPAAVGQDAAPGDVPMAATGFADADGDLHRSTDWEIWTVGASPERVWFSLGAEGVERQQAQLGDGFFENSHAGRESLLPDADYELRVRYRDDAGATSDFATRLFHATSDVSPLTISDITSVDWRDLFAASVVIPGPGAVLTPDAAIIGIDLDGNSVSPGGESPPNAIDRTVAKYLNFGEINSGVTVTPVDGPYLVDAFQLTTANDAVERDPSAWSLYGTNAPIVSTDHSRGDQEPWTLIDTGTVALPDARDTPGPIVSVDNTVAYASYRLVFTNVKNAAAANSMQIGELQFYSSASSAGPAASVRLETATGAPLFEIAGSNSGANQTTDYAALPAAQPVRVVINGGVGGLTLPLTTLTLGANSAQTFDVFLPAVDLAPEATLVLWLASDGSTYFGDASQTEPDFSLLARSNNDVAGVPFTALAAGYVVEEVAGGMQLPTNIAFVPNPGPNADDPFFYVTELYGTIKVVSRNFAVSDYAVDLLNFDPTGNFPGSGEQGLTGIVVEPMTGDVIVSRVTATNPANPNGAHHPQVLRFSSLDGGRTAATSTVLLDMPGETQGQSHQISNVSIGPDGKLYVHNGDGFNTATAQNLDSYRGKILRLNLDGSAPSDNPFYNASDGINARDYVFAYGVRNPFGGAWRAADGMHYEVENGPSVDRLAKISEGVNYLWDGTNESMRNLAIYNWDPSHAPVNIAFVQPETFGGSQFPPEMQDLAFVAESGPTYGTGPQVRGKRIVSFALDANGQLNDGPTTLVEYTGSGQGTVVGLTAGPDGLYFTELYKDQNAVTPIDGGARVFRVRYVGNVAGDFNFDQVSDGTDFLTWQRTLGSTADLSADGNRNLEVDAADLAIWESHWGVAPAQAIAEPASNPSVQTATDAYFAASETTAADMAGIAQLVETASRTSPARRRGFAGE
ncbi:MAG: PQQ-dependent sugar dehydrogenase, partial [Planctomycetales bacterium]|nr:PQQ-dependent sugar dehydrogenase [Planctomycetales bacterium]